MTTIPIRSQQHSMATVQNVQTEPSSKDQAMSHLNIQNQQAATTTTSSSQTHQIASNPCVFDDQDLYTQPADNDPSTSATESIDIDLAIQDVEPGFQISQQPNDIVYRARMSLLAMREDDPEYARLVREQRQLLRCTKGGGVEQRG